MKDGAINRLAKSITQLTLCQVTTSEVDATKLLDKACQKLQGIQNIPSQRVTDLEAAIRQLRQISCILDSCTISASYEVSQAQKATLLRHIQLNGQARHRKSLIHRYHHALMMSMIFHTMKTIGKSASVLEFTANRNDGAIRDVLVGCLSPLPHSGSSPNQPPLALCPSSKHH